MLLEDLRETRRKKLARQIQLARSTIRDQRSDVARIVSQWNRITKRINLAMMKYERVIDEIGLTTSLPLRAVELLDCLKSCQGDVQLQPLDDLEEMLEGHSAELKAAAAASRRRRTKRDKRRA